MNLKSLVCVLGVGMLALAADQPVEKTMLDRWMQELSNWGQWGKEARPIFRHNLEMPATHRSAFS